MGYITHAVKVAQSCLILCNPLDYTVHGALQARMLEWVAFSLLQGIFPTHGLNLGLPYCRKVLYYLSHKKCLHSFNHAILCSDYFPFIFHI